MDIQNTFYFLGIIFMSLSITILLGIVAILFFIMKGIRDIAHNINDKIDLVAEKATSSSNLAVDVGAAVAGSLIRRAREAMSNKS